MIDPKGIDELVSKLTGLVPAPLSQAGEELEKNFKASLQGFLQKADLVTREEFDVQAALLQRCRGRLSDLEARLAALENQASSSSSDN
ncbi:MAG: accessory factor UbiK family protein [bacterium]